MSRIPEPVTLATRDLQERHLMLLTALIATALLAAASPFAEAQQGKRVRSTACRCTTRYLERESR
jgi:hypothetical protein